MCANVLRSLLLSRTTFQKYLFHKLSQTISQNSGWHLLSIILLDLREACTCAIYLSGVVVTSKNNHRIIVCPLLSWRIQSDSDILRVHSVLSTIVVVVATFAKRSNGRQILRNIVLPYINPPSIQNACARVALRDTRPRELRPKSRCLVATATAELEPTRSNSHTNRSQYKCNRSPQ